MRIKKRTIKRLLAFIIAICFFLKGMQGEWTGISSDPAVSQASSGDPADTGTEGQVSDDGGAGITDGTETGQGTPEVDQDGSDGNEEGADPKESADPTDAGTDTDEDKAEPKKTAAPSIKVDRSVNGAELKVGDMVRKKTLIRMDNTRYEGLCLDGTDVIYNYKNSEDGVEGYITEENVIVVKDNPERSGNYLYVETIYGKGHVITEQVLRAMLDWDSTVTLHGNILLSGTISIGDGGEHTIDLNGYALDMSGGKSDSPIGNKEKVGSVIWVHNKSTLIIKDSSKDKSGEICGGNWDTGGGINVTDKGSSLVMTGGNVTLNTGKNGAGIFLSNGTSAKLTGVTISQNNLIYQEAGTGASYGGGIHIAGGAECEIKDCIISGNYGKNGGGISNTGTLKIENSEVKSNQASGEGAGIFSNGNATLIDTEFSSNMAGSNGGAISNKTNMTMKNCTVSNNSSASAGGGIFTATRSDNSKMVYSGKNTIKQNNAKNGGGIYIVPSGDIKYEDEISNVVISDNYASESGGGMVVGWDLKEVILNGVTVKGNQSNGNGGGIVTISPLTIRDSEIRLNTSQGRGGGIYSDFGGKKQNLTITNSAIQENICYGDGGGGIWMADTSTNAKLVLGGGKTVIYMNRKAQKDNSGNKESDNDIEFAVYHEMIVTGTFANDSLIGFNYRDSFSKRNATRDYKDYNSSAPDTYFVYNGSEYKVSNDAKQPEVLVEKKLQPSASDYSIRVKVEVLDDADDWDDAHIEVYCRRDNGVNAGYCKIYTGNMSGDIDHDGGVYDNTWNCGKDFPYTVNVYANFGGGLISRDWKARVTIWINKVNVKSYIIYRDLTGNTAKKGQANNWIDIAGDKYPYPKEIEIDQKREIDLLNEKSKEVSITCVDQYGVSFRAYGSSNYQMENISFPKEDTYECLDNYGMKWKFDSSKDDCHNSVYKLRIRSGSNVNPWIEIPISVRFKAPLKLVVKMGDKVVLEKKGYPNDTVKITGITPDTGYKIDGTEKKGLCVLQTINDGYNFTFLTESVVINILTAPIKYYIAFNNNASDKKQVTGSISKIEAYYDQKAVLPNCIYVSKKGYVFSGWNTEKDGSGMAFADGAIVENLLSENRKTITLYAQWRDAAGSLVSASIFSDGRIGIWTGVILFVVLGIYIESYFLIKKKKEKKRGDVGR